MFVNMLEKPPEDGRHHTVLYCRKITFVGPTNICASGNMCNVVLV